jgi:hypothetical protein
MRRAAKIDSNHLEIVAALRGIGAYVMSLASVGGGCPDLLVGFRGHTFLVEIKDGSKPPSARQLTEAQLKFHREWLGGTLAIVDSPEAALRMLGVVRGNP